VVINLIRLSPSAKEPKFYQRGMENNKVSTVSIIIFIIVIFVGILTGWYFYSKREISKPQSNSQTPTTVPAVLTKNQIDNLIKAMSASPTATPTLSNSQLEKLSKSMSASKTAKPALTSDEQRRLVESMSAK